MTSAWLTLMAYINDIAIATKEATSLLWESDQFIGTSVSLRWQWIMTWSEKTLGSIWQQNYRKSFMITMDLVLFLVMHYVMFWLLLLNSVLFKCQAFRISFFSPISVQTNSPLCNGICNKSLWKACAQCWESVNEASYFSFRFH